MKVSDRRERTKDYLDHVITLQEHIDRYESQVDLTREWYSSRMDLDQYQEYQERFRSQIEDLNKKRNNIILQIGSLPEKYADVLHKIYVERSDQYNGRTYMEALDVFFKMWSQWI